MPLGPDLLVLNLGNVLLNGRNQCILLVTFGQLERLLNDEVAKTVADEGIETRSLTDPPNEGRSGEVVIRFEALFDDTGGVFLDTELRYLVSQLLEDRPADFRVPLFNDRAHGIVAIRIRD